ncbi:MAG: RHS repeat domain-containing protein, partial [Lachnospiraceae bacterium]
LSEVTKDGEALRTYGYDAFGNRTRMTEGDSRTTYTYNACNQLMSRVDAINEETYAYDRRGNLSLIMENGTMKNSYTYGALNRLEQAVNGKGEAAAYEYNGLGHRVGKTITSATEPATPDPMGRLKEQSPDPETKIRYTIDLTRGYHNLLQKEETGSRQTYLWDGNVAGMKEEAENNCYYFQDELGSPVRLMDEEGSLRETYGYDEFGQDLYGNQGEIQPFGYTGYQSDRVTGTYYAQAREYRAELGRFAGRDIIKGYTAAPYTLNEYGYCFGNPMILVDPNGEWPQWIIDAFNGDGSEMPEWLERIIEGNEAHRLLQARFMQDYGGRGGAVEYYVGSGINRNSSGTGRADIVYFNSVTRRAEVYEIKPFITYGPGMPYHQQGYNQMLGYVGALNNGNLYNGWRAKPGTTLNTYFNTIIIPSKLYNGKKEIVYQVYEDGMITYFYRDRQPERQLSEVTEEVEEKMEEWQRNLAAAWKEYGTVVIMSLIVVLLIACIVSGGSLAPASAAAIIVLLLINRELVNQTECDVA